MNYYYHHYYYKVETNSGPFGKNPNTSVQTPNISYEAWSWKCGDYFASTVTWAPCSQ